MKTLGLDPSLTGFGWCVHDSEAVGASRVIARGHYKTNTKDLFVKRYIELRQLVLDLLDKYPYVQYVGMESTPFGEMWSEGLYGLFVFVNEALYIKRKDVVFFDPQTVKMLVKISPKLVKGSMRKADMIAAAREDTGIKGRFNHNEADAYHIARFAARFWEFYLGHLKEADLSPAEKHSFARTHTYTRGKKAGITERKGLIYREGGRFIRYSKEEVEHGTQESNL